MGNIFGKGNIKVDLNKQIDELKSEMKELRHTLSIRESIITAKSDSNSRLVSELNSLKSLLYKREDDISRMRDSIHNYYQESTKKFKEMIANVPYSEKGKKGKSYY